MTKKALRAVRERLIGIRTDDPFVADMVGMCIVICDDALRPGYLPPHQSHSDTSSEAALAIAPKFGPMTLKVLTLLFQHPVGLTDEEAQRLMDMEGNSYRPCRVTLADKGYVWDTGRRRLTSRRRRAAVWAITDRGQEYLEKGHEA